MLFHEKSTPRNALLSQNNTICIIYLRWILYVKYYNKEFEIRKGLISLMLQFVNNTMALVQ